MDGIRLTPQALKRLKEISVIGSAVTGKELTNSEVLESLIGSHYENLQTQLQTLVIGVKVAPKPAVKGAKTAKNRPRRRMVPSGTYTGIIKKYGDGEIHLLTRGKELPDVAMSRIKDGLRTAAGSQGLGLKIVHQKYSNELMLQTGPKTRGPWPKKA